jgi:hypothetical protein
MHLKWPIEFPGRFLHLRLQPAHRGAQVSTGSGACATCSNPRLAGPSQRPCRTRRADRPPSAASSQLPCPFPSRGGTRPTHCSPPDCPIQSLTQSGASIPRDRCRNAQTSAQALVRDMGALRRSPWRGSKSDSAQECPQLTFDASTLRGFEASSMMISDHPHVAWSPPQPGSCLDAQ